MSVEELNNLKNDYKNKYEAFKKQNLKLDMSRGKPSAKQLDLSCELLSSINCDGNYKDETGFDCRNYGVLDGIPECKRFFAQMLDVDEKNIIVGGNSSLTMMFDYIAQCMLSGAGEEPWSKQGKIKFLCPSPGYDRHFSICEYFGIEMITIPMLSDGPDMDKVYELISDSSVKGMFVVPKYSNPLGITFSDECVKKFAAMKPAAKDFRVMWDNAYCIHDFNDTPDELLNIFEVSKQHGNEDLFIETTSTSKVTFAGAGISALAASDNNIKMIKSRLSMQTIGSDKLNQLMHAKYFSSADKLQKHMKLHAEILRPKFECINEAFEKGFGGKGIATWTSPNGGYFISLDLLPGCAKKVGNLCKEAGVVLTPSGATFPYGIDPEDRNIRIAPSFPPIEELRLAAELLCICVNLVSIDEILSKKK